MRKVLGGFWKVLKVLLIILGVIALLVILGGILAYNFFTIKEIKVCITDKVNNTNIQCSADAECHQYVAEVGKEFITSMEEMPPSLRDKINELFRESSYCEQTCRIKEIRGLEEGELGNIKACNAGEKEISYQLKAKDFVQFARFSKK